MPVVVALLIALAIAIPSAGLATGWMVAAVAGASALVGWWSTRRVGGITGDGYGAAIELGETVALLAAVAVR